jgi:hypothetical protein
MFSFIIIIIFFSGIIATHFNFCLHIFYLWGFSDLFFSVVLKLGRYFVLKNKIILSAILFELSLFLPFVPSLSLFHSLSHHLQYVSLSRFLSSSHTASL